MNQGMVQFHGSKRAAVVLIGLPASGKSTLARSLAATNPSTSLISTDTIRARLYGDESIQGEWPRIWQEVQAEVRRAAELQHFVIYDATNARRTYRKDAIALLRDRGFAPIVGVWLNVPVWVCLLRNQQRDRHVPEEVLFGMHEELVKTPPQLQEGFDRLLYPPDLKAESEWLD